MARAAQTWSKGWSPEGLSLGFVFFVDGEAVGEFGAVVGQDGVDLKRKALEKAGEKAGGGGGAAIGEDFQIDKAGGPIDRDIGVAAAAAQRRQVFDIDMDKAGRGLAVEGEGGRCRSTISSKRCGAASTRSCRAAACSAASNAAACLPASPRNRRA